MEFIDTHIHLQNIVGVSTEEVLSLCNEVGINKCVCVSACEADWDKVGELATQFAKNVVPAFALHPWYIKTKSSTWNIALEEKLKEFPQALIGECGFDGLKNPDYQSQAEILEIQLDLARKYKRTLLIHAVKATSWLENYWSLLPDKFVFHGFNGRPEHLKKILDYGGYVAVNEKILQNKTVEQIVNKIPAERLLLETDAPYQGKVQNIANLCKKIAIMRNQDIAKLAQIIYKNSLEVIQNG